MRNLILAVLTTILGGCGRGPNVSETETSLVSDSPLQVSATAQMGNQGGPATISARITNTTARTVTIRVRCTPIELDQNQGGSWRRIEDLRLCAPPDRTNLPPRTTIDVQDVRQVNPGEYRVVIEIIDGGQAVSTAFTVP